MNLVEELFREAAIKVDALQVDWGGMDIDLSKPFARKPIFELLNEATGQDLSKSSDDEIRSICKEKGVDVSDSANYGQMLDELMSKLVEPKLIQPTFVVDYPKATSPLAKAHRNGDPNLVERFELFIGGAEFANSFSELNDPIDQRERLEAQAVLREKGDDEAQPVDESFIQAMECGMPPTGGVGIGIDRMTMLLTGNRWIKDVILFPALRPEK
jgi:lysyl-tRNA synthetase class 2